MHSSLRKLPDLASTDIYQVSLASLPNQTYIYVSHPAKKILFNPWIAGVELKRAATDCCKEFLRLLSSLSALFLNMPVKHIYQVLPLTGSLFYGLDKAFESLFNVSLSQCFVGARRTQINGVWSTKISYINFEALQSPVYLLMADTIATGTTLEAVFSELKKHRPDVNVRGIAIFSIAGSLEGGKKIKNIINQFPDAELIYIVTNALFGLEDNGTDMPWLHKDTISIQQLEPEILHMYGSILGKDWCSIWDWGERANRPQKHLKEVIEKIHQYRNKNLDDRTRYILSEIEEKTEFELLKLNQTPNQHLKGET
jgi:hypothetical protein